MPPILNRGLTIYCLFLCPTKINKTEIQEVEKIVNNFCTKNLDYNIEEQLGQLTLSVISSKKTPRGPY